MASSAALDYLQEAIILGIDAIIFGVCLSGYYSHKNTIAALRVRSRSLSCEMTLDIDVKCVFDHWWWCRFALSL